MKLTNLKTFFLVFTMLVLSGTLTFAQDDDSKFKNEELLKTFDYKDNITYKTVNGEKLDLLMFFPKNKKFDKTPVMLFTHGGGWSGGDRYVVLKKLFAETMQNFLDNGIACVSVEYRLNKGDVTVKDQVTDCKDAGKFIVKHASEYNFDTEKMGVWGGSAGGHLSLMTGLAGDEAFQGDPAYKGIHPSYKCIVSYFPATTFIDKEVLGDTNYMKMEKLKKMLGEDINVSQINAKLLSPAEYIRKGNPPVMLLHGTADAILSYKNSTYFVEKAKKAGNEIHLVTIQNGGHGFSGKNISPSISEADKTASDFIVEKLTK